MKGSSTTFDDHITYNPENSNNIFAVRLYETYFEIETLTGLKKFAFKDLLIMHKALTKIMGKQKWKKKKTQSARIVTKQ